MANAPPAPKLTIAMPIAHQPDSTDYTSYYEDPLPPGSWERIEVVDYFGKDESQGLQLIAADSSPTATPDSVWNLYAFTHGYLSLRDKKTLALRLPSEFTDKNSPAHAFNSSEQFLLLEPRGPQLRHVLYAFSEPPGAAVQNAIRALLEEASHPRVTLNRVTDSKGGTQPLRSFLAAASGNLDALVTAFMNGTAQILVSAGDVIGNFRAGRVDIRFLDSCGQRKTQSIGSSVIAPTGRAINPSYYLYIVRSKANSANVLMLTKFEANATTLARTHPLDHLLSAQAVTQGGGDRDAILDHQAAHPPKPRVITVPVTDESGQTIAGRGIPIGPLGDWHESRNGANPFRTPALLRWRHKGTASDVARADWCKLQSQVKAGEEGQLPTGFNASFPPGIPETKIVESYWTKYAEVFNLVADAFEIPCEFLVAVACKESGKWPPRDLASSSEMDVIRMEPLNKKPAAITGNGAQLTRLANYLAIAGGNKEQIPDAPHAKGANADIPVPWAGETRVKSGNELTWSDLRELVDAFPDNVKVSPGVMQTLVASALGDLTWLELVYGAGSIHGLSFTHDGVALVADALPAAPPAGTSTAIRGDLFSEWFGVSVDAAGHTSTVGTPHPTFTKMKRALHNVIAGAAHVKRYYNTAPTKKNIVCDFDFPTVASGYNDGATSLSSKVTDPWRRLFALTFSDENYPRYGTQYFNAAVTLFNALPADQTKPAVRLWRQ